MPSDLACGQRLAWKPAFGVVAAAAGAARECARRSPGRQMNDAMGINGMAPLTCLKTMLIGSGSTRIAHATSQLKPWVTTGQGSSEESKSVTMHTRYTEYTDQVYRVYRPGIQSIQTTRYTEYTEYTDRYTVPYMVSIQTGIQVYRQPSGLDGH